jgi:hypothetical protein
MAFMDTARVGLISSTARQRGLLKFVPLPVSLPARAKALTTDHPSLVTPAPTAQQPTPTGKGNQNTHNLNTGGLSTNKPKPTGGSSDDNGGSGGGNSTTTGPPSKHTEEFAPNDPPGGIAMVTPAPTAPYQLYKIGDKVTWGWNYTNLQGTPTALDVLAAAVTASKTFTLTQNMTFATPATFVWDTAEFNDKNKAAQLVTDEYTLIIYDADSSVSAVPDPGYLGTFQGFRFGVYERQPYAGLQDGWSCASCINAGMSDGERRALGLSLTMAAVTVLSFTWFVTGFGGF